MPDPVPASPGDDTRSLEAGARLGDVLRRMAGTIAMHLYEMEMQPDDTYVCNTFIGAGLESLLGPLPDDRTPEEAWETAVHPDDRGAVRRLLRGDRARRAGVEVEYRLVGYDGNIRWVWDRMHPRRTRGRPPPRRRDRRRRHRAQAGRRGAGRRPAPAAAHRLPRPSHRPPEPHRLPAAARGGRRRRRPGVLRRSPSSSSTSTTSSSSTTASATRPATSSWPPSPDACAARPAPSEIVARQGGDEFLLLVGPSSRHDGARRPRGRPLRRPRRSRAGSAARSASPFVISGVEIFVSASIGISLFPLDADDTETLLKHADAAMYKAKDDGRDRYRVYAVDGDNPLAQLSMAGRLRGAIEREEGLVLHYQPLVRLETARDRRRRGAHPLAGRRPARPARRLPAAGRAHRPHGPPQRLGDSARPAARRRPGATTASTSTSPSTCRRRSGSRPRCGTCSRRSRPSASTPTG